MTIEALWQDYRQRCSDPLDEDSELVWLQEQAYKAGVTAAIGEICRDPNCFETLRESVLEHIAKMQVEKN